MPDLLSFLLGGLVPLVAAALTFAIGWTGSRRPAVAWSVGIIAGYAAGAAALEARTTALAEALRSLVRPQEAVHWIAMAGVLGVVPPTAGAALKTQRPLRWVLVVPIAVVAPLWLLWGGKYLPNAEVRASGFATSAWSAADAVLILGGVGLAIALAWWLWERAPPDDAPRIRSLLAILAITAAAAATGLSGSFSMAQSLGILAASMGGCTIAGWLLRQKVGPEAAAGPTLLIAGNLLLLATCYSELRVLHAAGLWIALALAAGWVPLPPRLGRRAQLALRIVLCMAPLAIVVAHAGVKFAEAVEQQQKDAAANPYLNLP